MKHGCLSGVLSQVSSFWMSHNRWCLLITPKIQTTFFSCACVTVGGAIFFCIGGRDGLLLLYWKQRFLFSSVRCLPSCDLSYFCSVARGTNSPSINISIVISAGRPRVAFRKMSWNWFLTFISQSGWGLLLARRVFTRPTHETILEVRGYSSSAQGLAQFFCDLTATLGKKQCANELFPLVTQVSPRHRDG